MGWEEGEYSYYLYEGGSEEDSKHIVELEPGKYEIEVHGVDGRTDALDEFGAEAGSGGYIKGTIEVTENVSIEIWCGGGTWGRHDGGSPRAGGSTEVLFEEGELIAVADGGGASGSAYVFDFNRETYSKGGGGGGRCGAGGTGDSDDINYSHGNDGECPTIGGYGGDGGDASYYGGYAEDGEDGGQAGYNDFEVEEQVTGGSQPDPNGEDHGWVKITCLELGEDDVKVFDGSDFEEVENIKVKDGDEFVDVEDVKKRDGGEWV